MVFHFNSRLSNNPDATESGRPVIPFQSISIEKLFYYISMSELICIQIDYWTVNSQEVAIYAIEAL